MNAKTKENRAAESDHWYYRDGRPCYQMEKRNGDGMRATTILDARRLGLVPSVSKIKDVLAAPGLESWKQQNLLECSLTLPKASEELMDDYAKRVVEDSKERGRKARDRGTELHGAIEHYIRVGEYPTKWLHHIVAVEKAMRQIGIEIRSASAERTFACDLGYGGKIDWSHSVTGVADFKTKDRIDGARKLAYDEHILQIAAYAYGIGGRAALATFRGLNIFIGVEDHAVRIHEWTSSDLENAFEAFQHLLAIWKWKNNYYP